VPTHGPRAAGVDSAGASEFRKPGSRHRGTPALGVPGRVPRRAGQKTRVRVPVATDQPGDAGRTDTLYAAELMNRLAGRCEDVYGRGRDIEFAFAGGQLYLLQCRAVTRAGS
jgi:Pyruvate phosphate dikinase, AMP/ATP-binding domain